MTDYDWKNTIFSLLEQKKLLKYENQFIDFFTNVFCNTTIPDKAWFGTNKSRDSISLVVGRIYLAAYVFAGTDQGIWLLLDTAQNPITEVEYKPVKSTINGKIKLTWLHTEKIENITSITQSSFVWQSFNLATTRVCDTPKGKSTVVSITNEKKILSSFWGQQSNLIDLNQFYQKLEATISRASSLTQKERLERLKKIQHLPRKSEVKTTIYNRNEYVVAEVLYRANGHCEHCNAPAPFFRDKNNTPYLEVHHKQPLSENGEDTIDNSIALCPNCHRHAHYGISTFINKNNDNSI